MNSIMKAQKKDPNDLTQYAVIDVFTQQSFDGLATPVVFNSERLDTLTKQNISNEMNAPTTVFLEKTKQQNKWNIETFNQFKKVDPALQTLIAASSALLNTDKDHPETTNTEATEIELEFVSDQASFVVNTQLKNQLPDISAVSLTSQGSIDRFVPDDQQLAKILGLIPADIGVDKFRPLIIASSGPQLIVPIKSYKALQQARINLEAWNQSSLPTSMVNGILLFCNNTDGTADFYGRYMTPEMAKQDSPPIAPVIPEFTHYLCAHPHIQNGTHIFSILRGAKDQRQSLIFVEMDNKGEKDLTIRVGGHCVLSGKGSLMV